MDRRLWERFRRKFSRSLFWPGPAFRSDAECLNDGRSTTEGGAKFDERLSRKASTTIWDVFPHSAPTNSFGLRPQLLWAEASTPLYLQRASGESMMIRETLLAAIGTAAVLTLLDGWQLGEVFMPEVVTSMSSATTPPTKSRPCVEYAPLEERQPFLS